MIQGPNGMSEVPMSSPSLWPRPPRLRRNHHISLVKGGPIRSGGGAGPCTSSPALRRGAHAGGQGFGSDAKQIAGRQPAGETIALPCPQLGKMRRRSADEMLKESITEKKRLKEGFNTSSSV
jgi:hypothetical protein